MVETMRNPMRQKREAKSGLGMCQGGKQRMPSPTMIPAIGEGRPTKEWGEELTLNRASR